MDDLQRMLIERACERLVTSYCHLVDHGEASRIADLFTEDGVWSAPGTRMAGRDDLRAGFQRRQERTDRTSRHVCQNFLCEVTDENHASGVVYLVLYRHDGDDDGPAPVAGPTLVGEYADRFERTTDGWRIAERSLTVDFTAPRT